VWLRQNDSLHQKQKHAYQKFNIIKKISQEYQQKHFLSDSIILGLNETKSHSPLSLASFLSQPP